MKNNNDSSWDTIDLGSLNAESHVRKAFYKAKAWAGDRPIDSRHALQAAMLVSREVNSEAFRFLASLLPLSDLQEPSKEQMPSEDETVFVLSEPLSKSFSIAKRFFGTDRAVWGRDFITIALLSTADPSLPEIAKKVNSTLASLQDNWYNFVCSSDKRRDRKLWRDWWHKANVPTPDERTLSTDRKDESTLSYFDIARVEPDSVSADAVDHLEVEQEARAFARVAASKDTKPPISVGVFGEWGSGKTFFMEKMHSHVQHLEKISNVATKENNPTIYHSNIVQIRFNAWHYMEVNLWASLVDHIFRELDKWLQPQQKQEEIEALFGQLSTARMLELEAVRNLVESRRREKEAKKNLARAREELADAESDQEAVTWDTFWSAVKDTFQESNDKMLSEDEKLKIADAAEALGFKDMQESGTELMAALSQAREQSQRGRLVVRSVASRLGNIKWVVILIGLLILIPTLLPTLIKSLGNIVELKFMKSFLEQISSTALALSSAAATATGWVGAAAAFAAKALDRLSSFQTRLDMSLKARKTETPQPILQAEQLLAEQRNNVDIAKGSLDRATELLDKASFEFGDSARSRLNRFIRDKITNGDYAKHLGIIATIRKDFDQLARIMYDVKRDPKQRPAAEVDSQSEERAYERDIAALVNSGFLNDNEKQAIAEAGKPSDKDLRFFQRIILYIDDLDRCPPDKVVEVLQACHLLLCFPLFIVVVAVDARWVSRSLLVRYEKLLEEDANGQDVSTGEGHIEGTASPRDYLEKIFQIPYWVRRMHGKASENFAKELITAVPEESDKKTISDTNEPQVEEPKDISESTGEIGGNKAGGDSGEINGEGKKPSSYKTDNAKVDVIEDPNPQSLILTKHEGDFLIMLAPYAGRSPRTIKRFANVYRLLRTGLSPKILFGLVGENGESCVYKAILGQLAIVTGAPTLADSYFDELERLDSKTPGTLLKKLETKILGKAKTNNQTTHFLTESPEWSSLSGVLKLLEDKDNSDKMITAMREHANVVKRYSFSARPYL
jgi:hypothetical protein